MSSKDPAAATPLRAVASARGTVESWLPFLESMVACRAMEGFVPVRLDGSDVRLASMYALQKAGWLLSTDVGDHAGPSTTADGAAALGALLATGDARDLLDSEAELTWLAVQLATIAGNNVLLTAFAAELAPGAQRWAEICDALSIARLNLDIDDDPVVVDDVFRSVAALHPDLDRTSVLLTAMEPYSAALLLTYAEMPPVERGVAAYTVMSRWWALEGQWLDTSTWGDRTADILFRRLAAEPAAATQFLLETSSAHPSIPFVTADDQRNVAALLVAGTNPELIEAHTAGVIIVPIMQWFAESGADVGRIGSSGPTVSELAATLAAPWLLFFEAREEEWMASAAANRGWGWESAGDGHDALAAVLHDGGAHRVMELALWSMTGAISAITDAVGADRIDRDALRDVASTMTSVNRLLEQQEIAWGDDLRFPVDASIFLAGVILAVWDAPILVAIASGIVTASPVLDLLERWDVVPPDRSEVRRLADSAAHHRAIGTTTVMLALVLSSLVERGVVADEDAAALTLQEFDGECPLDEARLALGDFVQRLGLDEELEEDIEFVLDSMLRSGEIAC